LAILLAATCKRRLAAFNPDMAIVPVTLMCRLIRQERKYSFRQFAKLCR
jgi:hypothetical protein